MPRDTGASVAASGSTSVRLRPRLDGVDALRGLAILFVLMNHVNMQLLFADVPYTRGLPRQLVSSLVWNGQRGVQIFFAISGFLITSTALQRWGSLGAVRPSEFYKLRFARIAPLLLLLLIVLSALHLAQMKHFVVSQKQGGLSNALLAALTFRINVLEARHGYLPGNWDILWSLSVEETFYLLFPIACKVLARGRLFVALLLILVVLGPFARTVLTHGNEVWQEYSYLGATDAIALGALTAILVRYRHLPRRVLRLLLVLGTGLLVFALCFTRTPAALLLYRGGLDMSVVAIGACMLIVPAAQTAWKAPLPAAPLLWIGRSSYEIYLTHMFLVLGWFAMFHHLGDPLGWAWPSFAVVITTAAPLGALVARVYSEPLNATLRKRFVRLG